MSKTLLSIDSFSYGYGTRYISIRDLILHSLSARIQYEPIIKSEPLNSNIDGPLAFEALLHWWRNKMKSELFLFLTKQPRIEGTFKKAPGLPFVVKTKMLYENHLLKSQAYYEIE